MADCVKNQFLDKR